MSHQPDLGLESRLWAQGNRFVAGLDEAGRGAWAGPVVAAAVVLPPSRDNLLQLLAPVRDSKLLTPRRREFCYTLVEHHALTLAVGAASAEEIDQVGIVQATRLAMQRAVQALAPPPDFLVIDALHLPALPIPQHVSFKSDLHHLSVAAASIVAKVTRDRWLVAMDDAYHGYGLGRHKGYGTAEHLAALRTLGPTPYHRHSFAPIRDLQISASPCPPTSDDAGNTAAVPHGKQHG